MFSPLFVLLAAAAPVELTVVQSTPARVATHPAKQGMQKHSAYVEKQLKRSITTAFVDAQGKLHVQCEQHAHAQIRAAESAQ